MIKTITLTAGTEYRLQNVDNKYCLVKNLGAYNVYVSKKPTIVVDADEVQCILPQTSEVVKDIQLENRISDLYFKCSENTKIEIQTSSDANFSKMLKGGEKLILERKYKLSELKTLNTAGTWVNDVYTEKGITFNFTTDFDDTIKTIKVNGTCSTTFNFTLRFQETAVELLTPGQMYLLSGCPAGGTDATYTLRVQQYKDNGVWASNHFENGNGLAIKPSYGKYNLVIRIGTGVVVNNLLYSAKLHKVLL